MTELKDLRTEQARLTQEFLDFKESVNKELVRQEGKINDLHTNLQCRFDGVDPESLKKNQPVLNDLADLARDSVKHIVLTIIGIVVLGIVTLVGYGVYEKHQQSHETRGVQP